MAHQSVCHVTGKVAAIQTIKGPLLLHLKEENVLYMSMSFCIVKLFQSVFREIFK